MLKKLIRFLKTSPVLVPLLALIDLVLYLVDRLAVLSVGPIPQKSNSLLIIRIDVLGDYLAFRPYMQAIRRSARYKEYTITLCANSALRSIAEGFDKNLFDAFIWTDIYKLSTQPLYRFRFIRQLRQRGFSVVFCPTYSRVLVLDDFLASATGAAERIGCQTDFVNIKRWESGFGNNLYTRLLESETGLVFEPERNRQLVEAFLREPVTVAQPVLDSDFAKSVSVPEHYVVLSLGAGQDFRVWPAERFAEVAKYILKNYPEQHILLTGAQNERSYAANFLTYLPESKRVLNLTGNLSIAELIYVLAKADLVVANETGVVHLAAATRTSTIVISQGKSLVRWHPYPVPIENYIQYLYPAFIEENRDRLLKIAPAFNPESPYLITAITTERVVQQAANYLKQVASSA